MLIKFKLLKILWKLTMKITQSSSKKLPKPSISHENASTCIEKGFPNQLLCNNCHDSKNLPPRAVRKPCE